jgi:hypothetical protein
LIDYFSDRHQFVKLSNLISRSRVSNSGVLQGAVLSPRLFSFYTVSISSPYSNVVVIKYADDVTVCATITNAVDLQNYFSAIALVSSQCKSRALVLNESKTVEIVFGQRNLSRPQLCDVPVHVNGVPVQQASVVKYLGVFLSSVNNSLSFKHQAEAFLKKSFQLSYYCAQLRHCVKSNSASVLDFVKVCVLPSLLHCFSVYVGFLSKNDSVFIRRGLKRVSQVSRIPFSQLRSLFSDSVIQQLSRAHTSLMSPSHPLYDRYASLFISSSYSTRFNSALVGVRTRIRACSPLFTIALSSRGRFSSLDFLR